MFRRERDMTPIVQRWMRNRGLLVRREVWTPAVVCDLVGCAFDHDQVITRVRKRQKTPIALGEVPQPIRRLAWWPLDAKLVAVELKLTRFKDVLEQARQHLRSWAPEAIVGMPLDRAERLIDRHHAQLEALQIGVLGVRPDGVEVLRAPKRCSSSTVEAWPRFAIVEGFWRQRKKLGYTDA